MSGWTFSKGIGTSPIVVTVVHAGRDYPADVEAALAMSLTTARRLEDRRVDALVADIVRHPVFVMTVPRLLIDLNRAETDLDERLCAGRPVSPRARGGLGLVPTRLGGEAIWREPPSQREVALRIARWHRPFHDAVADALVAARARFGRAVLIDVHSMPPLADDGADVVIGTRHGTSAGRSVVSTLEAALRGHGMRTVRDQPYAGGHVVERHGAPARGIDAVQIEFDRTTYLDARLDGLGEGAPRLAYALRNSIDMVARFVEQPYGQAAE